MSIPANITNIDGIGSATIYATGIGAFNQAVIGYTEGTAVPSAMISNLTIEIAMSTIDTGSIGFYNMSKLIDCKVIITEPKPINFTNAYGFSKCKNLINCFASIKTEKNPMGFLECEYLVNCAADTMGIAFRSCQKLLNCFGNLINNEVMTLTQSSRIFSDCSQLNGCEAIASPTFQESVSGYHYCNDLSNCKATIKLNSSSAYGFNFCDGISNCVADCSGEYASAFASSNRLHGCSGVGIANDSRIGTMIQNCKNVSCCRPTTNSTTSLLYGSNTKVDNDSVG